ncbi:hypothetical protein M426DRAFT_319399 [Hypoxylon sp. CI-4A]|nr:hypothetical protein M426DRAFT_319399 [Hypoxylon sp. CI-4A]
MDFERPNRYLLGLETLLKSPVPRSSLSSLKSSITHRTAAKTVVRLARTEPSIKLESTLSGNMIWRLFFIRNKKPCPGFYCRADSSYVSLGQQHHTASRADSQGVVRTTENIGKTKIQPLDSGANEAQDARTGLDDETVDASRINPLGGVRE